MDATELQSGLAQFYGSQSFFRHGLCRSLIYTEGVQWLAENAEAHWLLDAIASWQSKCRRDPMLRDMQFWTLKKVEKGWELLCERDAGDVAFKQKIPRTDFPLDEIKLWVEVGGDPEGNRRWVLMLPSER